jgi:hypothetical protein
MVFHCCAAGTIDHTEHSFVNDFQPLLRDGALS